MSRAVLYQWTHSAVACSTSPMVASPVWNGDPGWMHSVL